MDIREDFENFGFVSRVDVLTKEKADDYSNKCESFVKEYQSHPSFSEWIYYRTELVLKWVADLASEDSILDVVEELVGPEILLWNAFLPVKPPRSDAYFGWHQDATYWPVTPADQVVSVWVALSSVNQSCGGMQMAAGSHLLGALPHEKTYDKTSMLKRGQQVMTEVDESSIVDIDLAPGQASLHHSSTLHRSGPNHSNSWRLGVGLNYVGSQVAPMPGYDDCAMPLRGNPVSSGFVFTQPPRSDLDSEALERFAAVLQHQSKRYSDVEKP